MFPQIIVLVSLTIQYRVADILDIDEATQFSNDLSYTWVQPLTNMEVGNSLTVFPKISCIMDRTKKDTSNSPSLL